MFHFLALIISSLLITTLAAVAGTLGPSKPSDLVVLSASSAQGPCAAAEFHVDTMRIAGVGAAPLEIPKKRVLVITSVGFRGTGDADTHYFFLLSVAGEGPLVLGDAGFSDATGGQVVGSIVVPHGVVVMPGDELCSSIQHNNSTDRGAFVRIHGYFAKDR